MNYTRWFPGDYLRDTMHLTWLEDLAYRRLLDTYYVSEKPLPADREVLYALVRAVTKEQQKAVEKVLAEFFIEHRNRYTSGFVNARARKEVQLYKKWKETASSNGAKGGRPKKIRAEETRGVSKTSPVSSPPPIARAIPTPHTPTPSHNNNFSQDQLSVDVQKRGKKNGWVDRDHERQTKSAAALNRVFGES